DAARRTPRQAGLATDNWAGAASKASILLPKRREFSRSCVNLCPQLSIGGPNITSRCNFASLHLASVPIHGAGQTAATFYGRSKTCVDLGQVLVGLAIRAWRAQHSLRVTVADGGHQRARCPRAFDFRARDR